MVKKVEVEHIRLGIPVMTRPQRSGSRSVLSSSSFTKNNKATITPTFDDVMEKGGWEHDLKSFTSMRKAIRKGKRKAENTINWQLITDLQVST